MEPTNGTNQVVVDSASLEAFHQRLGSHVLGTFWLWVSSTERCLGFDGPQGPFQLCAKRARIPFGLVVSNRGGNVFRCEVL